MEASSDMQVKRAALMLFRGDEILVLREKKEKEGMLLWSVWLSDLFHFVSNLPFLSLINF